MTHAVHVFDNGVKVYDKHLLAVQRNRYKKRNVHEAEEEDIFIEILRSIPPDGMFVNIGAAIGYYPILAKKLAPGLKVHAIEPLERHRRCFMDNLALNELDQLDFVVHGEGMCSWDGYAEFLDKGYGSSIRKGSASSKTTHTIKTRTLDNLCIEIGRVIDLCQMDVQGLELDVLTGATDALESGGIRTFLIGTHSERLHDECMTLLVRNGYAVEYENYNTTEQPDGILVVSKGCHRLSSPKPIPRR